MIWISLQTDLGPFSLFFYCCHSNAVMTTCVALLPNKTQISPRWLRSTLLYRSHPSISLRRRGGGGVDWPLRLWLVPRSSFLALLGEPPGSFSLDAGASRRQCSTQSSPPRQRDLLLTFIFCVIRRFKPLHEFIPGSRRSARLTGHLLSASQELRLLGLLYSESDGNVLD